VLTYLSASHRLVRGDECLRTIYGPEYAEPQTASVSADAVSAPNARWPHVSSYSESIEVIYQQLFDHGVA